MKTDSSTNDLVQIQVSRFSDFDELHKINVKGARISIQRIHLQDTASPEKN